MRGSWDSPAGNSKFVDSESVAALSGMDSEGVMGSAEMAEGRAMGVRVLQIRVKGWLNDRCCIYVESTSVV